MAANEVAVANLTQEAIDAITQAVNAFSRLERFALMVGPKGVDYATTEAPAYFQLDEGTKNITGFSITRAEVAAAMVGIVQLGRLLNNQAVNVQADHYAAFRKLANPRLGA